MIDLKKLSRHMDDAEAIDLKYMSYSSEAVLQQSPVLGRILLLVIALFITVMIVWAALANVDEFTRGEGRIVPSSDIQIVQNLEGGILARLMVQEGQLVERDQPLLQIDDTIFASSFRERQLQIRQLTVKAARLRAEANGTSFEAELEKLGEQYPKDIVEEERQLYMARKMELTTNLSALKQKVKQKQQELSSVRVEKNSLIRSYNLQLRELKLTRPLVKEGAVSQVELLRLERQTNDLQGDLERAQLAIPQLESSLQEARRNVESLDQGFASNAREELTAVTSELHRIEESNQALADKVRRTVVRSPVKGTVKQLKVKTPGGVIQPGMDLVEIVPIEDSLLVDAKVLPADIAFIHPGQNATVKFTAYDYSIHGGLSAEVVRISPDTIIDDQGVSYYQVRLQTHGRYTGNGEEELPIIPGMLVHVDILTGKKTVLDYLLKPILKTRELALRER